MWYEHTTSCKFRAQNTLFANTVKYDSVVRILDCVSCRNRDKYGFISSCQCIRNYILYHIYVGHFWWAIFDESFTSFEPSTILINELMSVLVNCPG